MFAIAFDMDIKELRNIYGEIKKRPHSIKVLASLRFLRPFSSKRHPAGCRVASGKAERGARSHQEMINNPQRVLRRAGGCSYDSTIVL